MRSNVSVIVVDSNTRFKGGVSLMLDNARNKVGNYSKSKIESFKKKTLEFVDKMVDIFTEVDIAVSDSMDNFADKIIDSYVGFQEKKKQNQEIEPKKEGGISFDDLQPMMSDEEFERLGIDIDNMDNITELQEFKKELMMGNFSQTKENKGPVRRLVPKRDINNRGVFNIWMTIIISVMFLGIFIAVAILNY